MRTRPVAAIALFAALVSPIAADARGRLSPRVEAVARAYESGGPGWRDVARAGRLEPARRRGREVVTVIVDPGAGRAPSSLDLPGMSALGVDVDAVSRSFVRVFAPPGLLRRLADAPGVDLVRTPRFARAHALGLGSNLSESVALTGAADLQNAGFTGAGVAVAVVDLGFIGLGAAIAAGELPSGTVVADLPGSQDDVIESDTEHGVGVAEHVMDMAPGALLHVVKVDDEVDLENAADYIRDAGVRVANHSVGWVLASYYDDTGPISAAVNDSRDQDGVFWSVSAGNDAERHWRGTWIDADADDRLDFAPGDDRMQITEVSDDVCLFLNWDQYPASATDLDLYVYDKNGVLRHASTDEQSGTQEPSEWVCFAYQFARAPYAIEVEWFTPSSPPPPGLDITLFSFDNGFEYPIAASSLDDPASAHGAFAVAAINRSVYAGVNPPAASYSSQGPTTDGRPKPEISAPDGTTSLTFGFHGAFGTSFSAPTVAGAAALLLEEDPSRTADDLADRLADLAIDVGAAGADPVYGAGKLHVAGKYACRDGIDNDDDGFTDFPDDVGCQNATSNRENPACNDGVDNDGDLAIDLADPDCGGWPHRNREFPGDGGCGLGGELVALLPLLRALRRRPVVA